MKPGPGETVIFDGHPSWRSVLEIYVKGGLLAMIAGAALWFAVSPEVGVAAGIVIALLTILAGFVRRRATRYIITNQRLYVRHGLLSRFEQQTRLERVQDVSTRQSFFERVLQIGTVDFDTAGEDAEDFRFVGVGDPRAVVEAVDAAQRATGGGHPPTR